MAEEIKRMRYFDGLFMAKEEFQQEQDYNVRMRRLHNRHLHGNGIVFGLGVETTAQDKEILVRAGMALDKLFDPVFAEDTSREIIIVQDRVIDLGGFAPSDQVYVWVEYEEVLADVVEPRGGLEPIHIQENSKLQTGLTKPTDEDRQIILARVDLDASGVVTPTSIQFTEGGEELRTFSAISAPRVETDNYTFRAAGVSEGWAFAEGRVYANTPTDDIGIEFTSPRTDFTGDVNVADNLNVQGDINFTGSLTVSGDFAGRIPLGGVVPVFDYGTNIPAATGDITGDGFMLADGAQLPNTTALHALATANAASTARPDLTNDVFIMGATASGTTGGANQVTVTVPPHSHENPPVGGLDIAGQGNVVSNGTTFSYINGGLENHSHSYTTFGFLLLQPFHPATAGPVDFGFPNTVVTGGPSSSGHGHDVTVTVDVSGLTIAGTIGSGQSGDDALNHMAANPHENRPNYLSAVYLIRVN